MNAPKTVFGLRITPGQGRILVAIVQSDTPVSIDTYHRISERAFQRMDLLRSMEVDGGSAPHWQITETGRAVADVLLASNDLPTAAGPAMASYVGAR